MVLMSSGFPYKCLHICQGTSWISFLFFFLEMHLQRMEVPGLGVESELQLLAYATATATPDQSHIFDLLCSLQQLGILNPLIEARDRICILIDTLSSH